MFGSVFGFKGRIGRVRYLLSCLGLGPALLIAFILLMFAFGFHPGDKAAVGRAVGLAALIVAPVYFWAALSLQSCRFRDIGWSPAAVIVGWMGFNVLLQLLARASGHAGSAHTAVVALITLANLFMTGVLLFWPGQRLDRDYDDIFGGEGAQPAPAAPVRLAPRMPSAAGASAAPAGFGRRGL